MRSVSLGCHKATFDELHNLKHSLMMSSSPRNVLLCAAVVVVANLLILGLVWGIGCTRGMKLPGCLNIRPSTILSTSLHQLAPSLLPLFVPSHSSLQLLLGPTRMDTLSSPENEQLLAQLRMQDAPRLSAHISTDKPIFHVGERVWWRAVVVDAFTHAPAPPSYCQVHRLLSLYLSI